MDEGRKVEKYVPNKNFDSTLDGEGLAGVICSEIDKCWTFSDNDKWAGGVDMGSGFIGIDVYGTDFKDIRVEMSYNGSIIRRDLSRVRGVFGDVGLRRE